jgi:hypothetical protein
MTQLMGQMQQSQHRNDRVNIREFLELQPPTFQPTDDPIDADDWLKEINRTLSVAAVAEQDKVLFATHLLIGESAAWWENFQEMRGPDVLTSWAEFVVVFKHHYVPEALMERKKEQFCSLVQGTMSVLGYSREFSFLARYGGDEVSTDARKQRRYRNGLKPQIKYALTHLKTDTFEDLVNAAIREETGRHAYEESRKHTLEIDASSTSVMARKRRMWVPNPAPHGPAYVHMATTYVPRPPIPMTVPTSSQVQPRPSSESLPRQMGPRPSIATCFKCGEPGHVSIHCPQNKLLKQKPRSIPAEVVVRAPPIRLNHIKVEHATKAPDVVLGTLLVNSISATILFNTGASLSFVSQKFALAHDLPLDSLPNELVVYSPGAQMHTSKISHGNQILIGSHLFPASLIVLVNSDIDVILGMDWLNANKAVIDCAKHSVSLPTPEGQIIYSPSQTPSVQLQAFHASSLTGASTSDLHSTR